MPQRLVVVEYTDAFSQVWADLADRISAELVRVSEPTDASGPSAIATLLACGGEEGRSVERVHDAHRAGIEAPIVVGASTDHRLAVQLMRAGAATYFALPGDMGRLESDLLAMARASSEEPEPTTPSEYDFSAIVGEHPTLKAALDRAAMVIPGGKATVLILGETGTGKELFARALHDNGPRARKPFVAVNCSAIPGTLLESELFGHEKGSFTDARSSKPGLFELANDGTIFLDEISSMPLELQAKLLRFLETRELRRLGGIKTTLIDVRILAAANEDLTTLVREGSFRKDLYYRLAVIPILLPPLRERGDDVVRLARHFAVVLAETYGSPTPDFTREALSALEHHRWPGNVRELRNAIERGLLLSGGAEIRPEHLALDEGRGVEFEVPGGSDSPLPFPATLEELERAAALAMVELYTGNKSEAARELGITRSRLYRILSRAETEEGVL